MHPSHAHHKKKSSIEHAEFTRQLRVTRYGIDMKCAKKCGEEGMGTHVIHVIRVVHVIL